ncbi:hypothetical protein OROGR_000080 [Orobanche gracilis]
MSVGKNATLVFIPFPVVSHQTSVVKMAKLLTGRDKRLSVTIILLRLPVDNNIDSNSNKISPDSSITFVELPKIDSTDTEWRLSPISFMAHFISIQMGAFRDAVANLSKSSKIVGFVVDMFCTAMIDVASELGIPSYVFFTCGAASLGLFLHLQNISDEQNLDLTEYKNSDAALSIPTYVHPVPATVWPTLAFEKEITFWRKFSETKGILMNTFLEFETHAISAISRDEKIPPVYPVGPIMESMGEEIDDRNKEKHGEIIEWLDGQHDLSVVFLCFGSRGCFERDQVTEIAVALENSGHRFLWSLRKPPPKEKFQFPGEYEDFREVLPDGFLDRMVGIGKVIGWAPQMDVLSHPAVGGFVSHCGWNSTLESVCCNVPMATWPLSAEQQANAFQLVKEFGMAVDIKMEYNTRTCNEIVPAEKIEKAVRELMDPGNEGRAKVKMLSEKSREVMTKGGSSYDFLGRFIDSVWSNVS